MTLSVMNQGAKSVAPIDPSLDLFDEIERLKKERNAVIMAHYYQELDIQDIADVLGDSLLLAREAQKGGRGCHRALWCSFHGRDREDPQPRKDRRTPDLEAGCSLADSCPPEEFAAFKAKYPDHVVVSYVNTTAEIKALSDWTCTSSNATKIVEAIPADQPIIFAPDVNLGRYVQEQNRTEMKIWEGSCMVHETFNERRILKMVAENLWSELIAHPECEETVLRHASLYWFDARLLKHTQESDKTTFIVATEVGILHTMRKAASLDKTFIAAAPEFEEDGDVDLWL